MIYFGADHRGWELKTKLVQVYRGGLYDLVDLGPENYDALDDYNDMAVKACRKVLEEGKEARAILVCGSAQGEMMQANRFRGIRAVDPRTAAEAAVCRQHHDANVLCLAAEILDEDVAKEVITAFLTTEFGGEEKYERRIRKLDEEA
jgi:ribose 5-phosphate isomerase B